MALGINMDKKITIIGCILIFILVTISFASAIETNTEQKESPLYKLRTRRAIGEKINTIIENKKTRFLGDRTFFIPLSFLFRTDDPSPRGIFYTKSLNCDCSHTNAFSYPSCQVTCGGVIETICAPFGADCTFFNCQTFNTDTCKVFCFNK